MTGTGLIVPDPRTQTVPKGWAEEMAEPAITSATWDELDEQEAQILAFASYIESFRGDVTEFEKALRMVEYRRGMLLGEPEQGRRTDLEELRTRVSEVDIHPRTASRYRKIARWWDELLRPHVLKAETRRECRQKRLLELVRIEENKTLIAETELCGVSDLSSLIERGIRFGTVYADPPWPYDNQATRASTDNHYDTPTLEWIAGLPVSGLAAENAHLHLWTTNAFLFDAKTVMEAWGFTYKSCFIWVKPQMGIGNYWRVSHEFLLLGVRGSQPFLDRSQMSWGEFKRGRHSAKPWQLYDIIQRTSPGPYLELFARREVPGWVVWGNEIERDLFSKSAA